MEGGRRSVGVHSWKLDRKGVRGGGVVLEGEKGEGRVEGREGEGLEGEKGRWLEGEKGRGCRERRGGVAGREGEGLQGEKGRGCRERRGGVGGRDALQPLPSL